MLFFSENGKNVRAFYEMYKVKKKNKASAMIFDLTYALAIQQNSRHLKSISFSSFKVKKVINLMVIS